MDEPDKNSIVPRRPIPRFMYRVLVFVQPWQLRRPRFWAGVHIVLGCVFVGLIIPAYTHHIYWLAAILPIWAFLNFATSWLLFSL